MPGKRRTLSDKRSLRKWLWVALVVLSPLAALAGEALWIKLSALRGVQFTIDRDRALSIGREFADSHGFSTEGLASYVTPKANEALHAYYRQRDSPITRRLREAVPEVHLRVVMVSEQGRRSFETLLSSDGRILGFRKILPAETLSIGLIHLSSEKSPTPRQKDETGEAAERIAGAAAERRLRDLSFLSFGPAEAETDRQDDVLVHTFSRKASSSELPGLEIVNRIQVAGESVVEDTIQAEVDPKYASQHLFPHSTAKSVFWILLGIVGLAATIYALVRYVRRAREKETSHRRNLGVGLIVAVSLSISAVLVAFDSIGITLQRTPGEPLFLMVIATLLISYTFAGMLFGLIWGATEGEVREAFPGKLTSLDALVVGRLFSRNVARSVMYGCVMGAWALLASAAAQWPWSDSPQFGGSLSTMVMVLYSRLPWLTALVSPGLGIVSAASLGVLLPLAFSFRHLKSPRLRMALTVVLAILGSSTIALKHDPFGAAMSLTLVVAAVLLSSFLWFDLLTAMVALGMISFLPLLTQIGVSNTSSRGVAAVAAGIILLLISVEIVCAFRGGECLPQEVQPIYADHQSLRQAMQAEVSAAREAQLRLMPQRPPDLEGLSLAADCRPARVVGGDFYDFFPIADHRLGIFFAEGGGTGLSAALSIAYAKGLLMPMVGREPSPRRIVNRLREALAPWVVDEKMGLLYSVIDTSSGLLSCARFGYYPKMIVCRADGTCHVPRQQATDSEAPSTLEWTIRLEPDDEVILFTDGVETTLRAARESPADWISGFLSERRESRVDPVHLDLMNAVDRRLKHARKEGMEDDLATILLKLHRLATLEREEVA